MTTVQQQLVDVADTLGGFEYPPNGNFGANPQGVDRDGLIRRIAGDYIRFLDATRGLDTTTTDGLNAQNRAAVMFAQNAHGALTAYRRQTRANRFGSAVRNVWNTFWGFPGRHPVLTTVTTLCIAAAVIACYSPKLMNAVQNIGKQSFTTPTTIENSIISGKVSPEMGKALEKGNPALKAGTADIDYSGSGDASVDSAVSQISQMGVPYIGDNRDQSVFIELSKDNEARMDGMLKRFSSPKLVYDGTEGRDMDKNREKENYVNFIAQRFLQEAGNDPELAANNFAQHFKKLSNGNYKPINNEKAPRWGKEDFELVMSRIDPNRANTNVAEISANSSERTWAQNGTQVKPQNSSQIPPRNPGKDDY
ncbi:MAG: hypothetical protein J6Y03_06075 [Alphaproteobacteria bacterium]|nr:hypothetical protein [Alphaproteobacteria bacterium]